MLSWKTGLKENVDKVPSEAHIFLASAIPSNGYISSTDFSYYTAQMIMECQRKICKSHWSAKYRSRSPGQGTCQVRTLRRSPMEDMVAVGLIVEEISNINVKCVKYRSTSLGQGTCQVSTMR